MAKPFVSLSRPTSILCILQRWPNHPLLSLDPLPSRASAGLDWLADTCPFKSLIMYPPLIAPNETKKIRTGGKSMRMDRQKGALLQNSMILSVQRRVYLCTRTNQTFRPVGGGTREGKRLAQCSLYLHYFCGGVGYSLGQVRETHEDHKLPSSREQMQSCGCHGEKR